MEVDVEVPLSESDTNTPPHTPPPPHGTDVHMDAMAFGMGCCCLQVTFQVSACGVEVTEGLLRV